jgi:hypothetical protein
MLPGTFLYVFLGSAAQSAAHLSQPASGPLGSAAFWAGIAATVAVVAILTRIARRALERTLGEKPA